MFETLSDRLEGALGRLRRKSRLTQRDVDETLAEIRLALLEADVNVAVVDAILDRVGRVAVGAMASASLTPGQQVIKAVHDELLRVLGGEQFRLRYAPTPPTIILLAGLQGVGKTTAAAKLALQQVREGRSPLLVAADLQRPGAVDQLRILGERAGVPVVSEGADPVAVARSGVAHARRVGRDVVIVDTAGRLAIDEELMGEIEAVSRAIEPHYRLLVVDAMVGQEAVRTAQAFDARLSISAVILTKLDGDARGGAALSLREVVGKPIAFASVGEKLEEFEPFYPDRMASRILGMGDVLSLIERAEATLDQDVTRRGVDKLRQGRFDLDDLLDQMRQVRRLGPLKGVLAMLPGIPRELRNQDIDDAELTRVEAIISSMTREERRNPTIIDASRRARIARGSGTQPAQVSQLLKQFRDVNKVLRQAGVTGPSPTKRRKPPRRKRK